jgi:hypothetical protein
VHDFVIAASCILLSFFPGPKPYRYTCEGRRSHAHQSTHSRGCISYFGKVSQYNHNLLVSVKLSSKLQHAYNILPISPSKIF